MVRNFHEYIKIIYFMVLEKWLTDVVISTFPHFILNLQPLGRWRVVDRGCHDDGAASLALLQVGTYGRFVSLL